MDQNENGCAFEKLVETNIKQDIKKTLWPKWLTVPRMLVWGFFVLIPGLGVSAMYIAKGASALDKSIDSRIDKRVLVINDSINCAIQNRIKKLMMTSAKTNTYLEVIMNEETRNVAESKWKRDSLFIENNRY